MKVAVLKETRAGERRVALVPQGVKALLKAGLEVTIQTGAGLASSVSDTEYKEAGATIAASAAKTPGPRCASARRRWPRAPSWSRS